MFSLTYTPWFRKLSSSKFHNCGNTNYVAGERFTRLVLCSKINLFRVGFAKFENHETYPEAPEEISRTSVTCCLATVRVWSPSILFVELIFNTFLKLNRKQTQNVQTFCLWSQLQLSQRDFGSRVRPMRWGHRCIHHWKGVC